MDNGKIYKLTNTENDKIYIGSSNYQYLSQRIDSHRQMCKDTTGRRDSKLYIHMREIGIEKFKIELIEKYVCETKQQLVEREQYWIEQLKPELNMFRAIANPNYDKECRDKKERCEKSKAFYHSHKEEVLEKMKEYREENKDKIKERKKEYREKNKDKIKERKSKQITCDCGCIVSNGHLARHNKSKKHQDYINNI
jgi:group I intron endonuclease